MTPHPEKHCVLELVSALMGSALLLCVCVYASKYMYTHTEAEAVPCYDSVVKARM